MSSLALDAKRKRLKTDSDSVGPDQLRSWVSNAKKHSAFSQVRVDLIESPNIRAIHILQFVLEFVFGWSQVEIVSEYEEDYFQDGKLVHRTTRDVYYDELSRQERVGTLDFVTRWLGQDPAGESSTLPSLTRLCAQRIAIDMFHTFTVDLDIHFDNKHLDYFKNNLPGDVSAKLANDGVPEYLHVSIAEELFIFVTVYFLYIDIRTMVTKPPGPNGLLLPLEPDDDDDMWWHDVGRYTLFFDTISSGGRGSLAKVGLLAHAVLSSYIKKCSDVDRYRTGSYCHLDAIHLLFDDGEQLTAEDFHPFAYAVAVVPIANLVRACTNNMDYGNEEYTVWKYLVPWIGKNRAVAQKCSYDVLRLASSKLNIQEMKHIAPLKMSQGLNDEVVHGCLEAIYAQKYCQSVAINGDGGYGRRLRLNGSFSKEEILFAAVVGKDAILVDLEFCKNLDEECLEIILAHMSRLERVMLKGTQIGKHSFVIRNANAGRKQKVYFTFEDACKCCGGSCIKALKVTESTSDR